MARRRFLITSGLPYSNGRLHVGHVAGAYLPADIYVRYLRARGDEAMFICGSDDNGVANLIAARKESTTPEELSARYNAMQKADFAGLGIRFDIFGGTHQPDYVDLHNKISQDFFTKIHQKGHFNKRSQKQLFDPQADMFLADRFVKGKCPHCGYPAAYGDQCEDCGAQIDPLTLIDPVSTVTGAKPEVRETVHWYLRLDEFSEPLRQWLESKRDPAVAGATWRTTVLNFALGQISTGLKERAMTRDLQWGIPVPLDDPDAAGKVLYVWFDAPIGYVSFTAKLCERTEGNWQGYERWWKDPECKIVHFIGEDNTVFHALTWPAMLMSEGGYQLPHNVVANAFMNIKFPGKEEEKISKSRGTAIWIGEYLKMLEPDPLRYYLTAIAPEAARTTFDVDDFINRNNGELGNALGNFINRTLTFAVKYFDGKVPPPGARGAVDLEHLGKLRECVDRTADLLEKCQFKAALGEIMGMARSANVYFDLKQPWKQRKEDMAACGASINVCVQTTRTLTTLMAPFMPFSADKCLAMLQLDQAALKWDSAKSELPGGHPLGEPQVLFAKLDAKNVFAEA